MAEPRRIEAADVTWLRGQFRCTLLGDQRDAWLGGARLHGVRFVDARASAIDGLTDDAARAARRDAGPTALHLGRVEPLWVQLRDATTWMRVAVDDAVVLRPEVRLARDDGDHSVTMVSGTLVGRLAVPETSFAGVAAQAATIGTHLGSVYAEAGVIAARSLPVAAGGIAWADAQVGSDAPPGCASVALGCAVAPLGCAAVPLAVLGLWGALWGGLGLALGFGGAGLGLALLLAPLWLARRGWTWGGRLGWALTALAWACALAAVVPAWLAWLRADCEPGWPGTWPLLGVAALAAAASQSRIGRPVVFGVALLALALHGFAETGCVEGPIAQARDWALDETSRDADAERAARLQGGGGGRISLDQALAMSWPPRALCGRTLHLSDDLLFARNDAHVRPVGASQLRKLAVLVRRHPQATLVLEGHTDSSGDADANVVLSRRRAEAVRAWLLHQTRLPPGRIVALGVGASRPLVQARGGDDGARQRLNRRVEAVLRCDGDAVAPGLPATPTAPVPALPQATTAREAP